MSEATHKYIDGNALLQQMELRRFYVGRASDPICLVEDAPAEEVVPKAVFLAVLNELESAERALIWEYSCDIDADEKDLADRIAAYKNAAGIA